MTDDRDQDKDQGPHLSGVPREDTGPDPDDLADGRAVTEDDLRPPEDSDDVAGHDDPGEAPRLSRLEGAQSAASDLSRMGIDPRSLGIDVPSAPATRPARPDPDPAGGRRAAVADRSAAHQPGRIGPGPATGAGAGVGTDRETGQDTNVVRLRAEEPIAARTEPESAGSPAQRTPSQFESAVARTTVQPPTRPDPMRMLRTVARGLATPDAAASVQQERELIEAVRRRQTDRRLIAFVSGKGGVGCSAVAAGVGTTLMAMRDDRSVLVDVQQGSPSLGEWLGASGVCSVADMIARREDFEAPQAPSGLGVVDGARWDNAIGRSDVSGVLERLGVDHTFHLLDVGDDAGEAGHTAMARADLVVLVGGPGPAGAAAAAAALDRIRYVNPDAAGRVVSVLVCMHDATYRGAQRELAPGASGFPGLVVPPDPLLQGGGRFDPAALASATRESYLRVSAAVVTGDRR